MNLVYYIIYIEFWLKYMYNIKILRELFGKKIFVQKLTVKKYTPIC